MTTPRKVICDGGPFDGQIVIGWRGDEDTLEVYSYDAIRATGPSRSLSTQASVDNIWGQWRSRLKDAREAGLDLDPAERLGHYRLEFEPFHFDGRGAIWVPAYVPE